MAHDKERIFAFAAELDFAGPSTSMRRAGATFDVWVGLAASGWAYAAVTMR